MKEAKDQELLDVDNKGKAIQKIDEKKPAKKEESYTHILIIFLALVLLGLYLKIFIFNKSFEKNKIFRKFYTKDDFNRNVGDMVLNYIKQNPKCNFGLSSGSTPKGIYNYLIDAYQKGQVSFKNVKFFSIDGYCGLKKTDKKSYYYDFKTTFLDKIDAKEENIHLLKEEGNSVEDFENNAKEYNELLKKYPIDIQLLSFGDNGHIGFNEPRTDFNLETHIVKLTDEKREEKAKIFGGKKNVPEYAITQGVKNMLDAKLVIAIATGENKAKAVNKLVNGVYTLDYPITILRNHNGKVIVCTDNQAGQNINDYYKF